MSILIGANGENVTKHVVEDPKIEHVKLQDMLGMEVQNVLKMIQKRKGLATKLFAQVRYCF